MLNIYVCASIKITVRAVNYYKLYNIYDLCFFIMNTTTIII